MAIQRPPARFVVLTLAALGLAGVALPGCQLLHRREAGVVAAPIKPARQPRVAQPLDLANVQPNEVGEVPILEYHDLVTNGKPRMYQYPAEAFRQDIQWLYDHGYRPISLSDYASGKIDCQVGMSPVILTFDDALKGQFRYTDDGKIDPECAVGILDSFHEAHPDWPLKGTFFVLTDGDPKLPPAFYQAGLEQGKLEYLVKEGYEIGNHTIHHRMGMRHWPDAQVTSEFAGAVANIHRLLPDYNVQSLALPFGIFPKNAKLVVSGESGGVSYHNICALRAGAEPAPSPVAKNFNPYFLPRMIPGSERSTIRYWLNYIEKHKALKYVSDGDPETITVNMIQKGEVDMAKIRKYHLRLRVYSGTKVASTTT